jgi:hypothetical protein
LAVTIVSFHLGCSGNGDSCKKGSEGCSCFENETCNSGLSCRSKTCVDLGSNDNNEGDAKADASEKQNRSVDDASATPGASNEDVKDHKLENDASKPSDSSESDSGNNLSDAKVRDSSVIDGESDGDGSVESSLCLKAGEECTDDTESCCDDSMCVTQGDGFAVCAALCIEGGKCASNCCAPLNNVALSVCSPAVFCAPSFSTGTCTDLVLMADDGELLGIASSNEYATDSVCNQYSNYGSEYSSSSIFNKYGTYGSEFGQLSAYNEYTRTPPFLYCVSTDEVLNPITKNTLLPNPIDPDLLCATLAAKGY